MSQFELKLDAFEGPLDLLLYLVNRHKLDIYDIEISLLLEQYLEYIDGLEQEDFDQAGDFLAMAARLVYIKTCSLLPKAEEAEELKKELEGELIEYSVCKAAAERLRGICIYGDVFVRPPEKLPVNKVFTGTMDPQLLIKAYLGMSAKARSMKPIRAEQFKPIVASRIVTVTSKIVHVLKMLYTLGRCTVAELYEGVDDKSARVATFLAVLELTKSGRIMLNEDNTVITFNRDAPRRRRESPPQPKHEAAPASAEVIPERDPAQVAENTEQPKHEAAPAPAEPIPAREPAPVAENTEQPKHKAAPAPAEIVPAREPAQVAESTEQPKHEAVPAPAEIVPTREPAQVEENTEQPKQESAPAPAEVIPAREPAQVAENTEQPKHEAVPASAEIVPAREPAQVEENTEQPKHEAAPAPAEVIPAREPAPVAENTEQPKHEAVPAPAEVIPAREPAPVVESTEQPKHEAAPALAEVIHAREPAPVAESIEQPAGEKERPRTAAAVRYSGAVRTASGATMALPALAVFIYEDSAREVPPDEPQTVDIGDRAIYGGIKYNRFAARYFWGYPSAGNCYRYRRERL